MKQYIEALLNFSVVTRVWDECTYPFPNANAEPIKLASKMYVKIYKAKMRIVTSLFPGS